MSKTVIEMYLETLEGLFTNCKPSYDEEVKKFRSLVRFPLECDMPPHVFSGKIDDPNIVFITLNPKKRKDGRDNKKPSGASHFKENFLHLYNDIGGGIVTFRMMNEIAAELLGEKITWTYDVLHSDCVDIDFIPFYSERSGSLINTSQPQFKKQIEMIEQYIDSVKAPYVIMFGITLSTVFDAIYERDACFYRYNYHMGNLKDTGVTVKRRGTQKVALVSHALTAHGITADFYKRFIPSAIRGYKL
jgi:hypothetical protein